MRIDAAARGGHWRGRPLAEKATLALGMLALALAGPPLVTGPAVFVTMSVIAVAGARVAPAVWARVLALPLGFLAVGAAALLVGIDPGGGRLALAPDGGRAALALTARSAAAVSCLALLALTTPVTDLVAPLRRAGVPAAVADVMLLTYRFLILLLDTAAAMDAAQASRLGHAGWRKRLHSAGLLAAALLPRALARAERMEAGLAARGFDGDLRVLGAAAPASKVTLAAILGLETALAALSWGLA